MIRARVVAACLSVVMLASGCTDLVQGTARPAANLKPNPLTRDAINGVLVDAAGLSKILGQTVTARPDSRKRFGGPEEMGQVDGTYSPVECIGLVAVTDKGVYESADVKDLARQMWVLSAASGQLINVIESVVTLPSAADAQALFTKFTEQWKRCDGTTVTSHNATTGYTDAISDVSLANSVVTATVADTSFLTDRPSVRLSMTGAHALGVRVNCIVEVKVGFVGGRGGQAQRPNEARRTATDVADAILDKISAAS